MSFENNSSRQALSNSAIPRVYSAWAVLLSLICAFEVYAQSVDVTGTWNGASVAGGVSYPNRFTLIQNGTKVTGTIEPSSPTSGSGNFVGTIVGNSLSLQSTYPLINYSSSSSALTDGFSMSGTFLDSQGTSGTFSATKLSGPLSPGTRLDLPPVVQVNARTASVVMKRFTEVVSQAQMNSIARKEDRNSSIRAGTSAMKIQYTVTVKSGKTSIQKNSTRNLVTFKNLPPGKYTASYKVSALRGKKVVFTTKKSPAASFSIQK